MEALLIEMKSQEAAQRSNFTEIISQQAAHISNITARLDENKEKFILLNGDQLIIYKQLDKVKFHL